MSAAVNPDQQLVEALAQVIDEGVVLLDASGVALYQSPRATHLLRPMADEAPDRFWNRFMKAARQSRKTQDIASMKIGTQGRLRIRAVTVGESGDAAWLVVVTDDWHEDREQTKTMLASRMNSLLTVMRSAVHDLRAPMNSMVLNLDLLREKILSGEGNTEEHLRHVDVVREEINRLNRTLEGVLGLTRPERMSRRRVDLRRVVRELSALLEPQAVERGVTLNVQVPAEPAMVQGSRDQIKQALLNIALNGLEVLARNGNLEVTLFVESAKVVLTISDDGPGIQADDMARIFEMHFTTKKHGSGLGLPVARSVLQGLGAAVDLESKVGRGTTFTVTFPRVKGAA